MNEEIKELEKRSFTETIKKNKTLLASIIGIFIFICLSLFAYSEYKQKKIKEISDNFNKALILIQKKENEQASKILEKPTILASIYAEGFSSEYLTPA